MLAPIHSELKAHAAVMRDLKSKFSQIDECIGIGAKVAYIDYPAHFNTGDLLINIGTEAFFSRNGINVVSRYAIGDLGKYYYDSDKFILGRRLAQLDADIADGAILAFHGGGSFGDVWPHHQKLREALLERYSGVKAIVFPQSIQFGDRRKYEEAAKLCGRHGNLTIFVRDQESLEFLTASGVPGEILPDMAHELWENAEFFPFPYTSGTGELRQIRVDLEGGSNQSGAKGGFDWDDTQSSRDRALYKVFCAWRRLNPVPRSAPSYKAWYVLRDRVIGNGVDHFQKFESVRTDRLHGMILSSLLSKPIYFDDRNNKYRKLHRYHSKWLSGSPLITSA
ncbi:polysaccharide pyruvyl transferase family protein [Rhizobium rhizogenes]|uniref:polysaccharide pyruvyl transferase family protein n=1 Tax=Rhizobium rhizogenes TaxID=359 RepID=UPI0022C35BFC|nr:polysaccharide pyruvyl transferase family protein [Rhizobium rhizogenes]MCZ7464424.1 polysaccharide pyruvyl transferase family protein [Rhizobium rhizogenes]